jgi:antitoxin VapB
MVADLREKLDRLAALGEALGASTVVLREQASLSWLLGCRSHVPQTLDAACFDVVVDLRSAGLTVVANAIEAPRLRDTELADLAADWTVLPCWEGRDAALPTGPGVVADRPYADVHGGGPQVAALRRKRLAERFEAGILGVKQSGLGREGAALGLEEFQDVRYVAWRG